MTKRAMKRFVQWGLRVTSRPCVCAVPVEHKQHLKLRRRDGYGLCTREVEERLSMVMSELEIP